MKQFFKYTLASMLGGILAMALLVFIFIGILSMSMSLIETKAVKVPEKSVLHIKLNKEIKDRSSNDPFENFDFGSFKPDVLLGLNQICENIKAAAEDDNIKGIYLDLTDIPAGIATIEEIRNSLKSFKQSKKFIVCYSEYYSQRAYYLATVADEIYLNPEGYIEFKGMASTIPFLRGMLDKLEIDPQVIKHGQYKSAAEPLSEKKMSDANKKQTIAYVGSIWDNILNQIAEARNISINELNWLADSLIVHSAGQAEKYRLVDGLVFEDEFLGKLRKKLELEEKDKLSDISLNEYIKHPKTKNIKGLAKDRIAVIYASGDIVTGKGENDEIGGATFAKAVRDARLDDKVKAIVFRINSGGGSALASDVIWREVILAKKEKPVVASFGDVAASGGYYIGCAADTIVASPNTITGSIGVIGFLPNAQKFFENKLGIYFDGVKTNAHADLMSTLRPLTDTERAVMQKEIGRIYYVFTSHVAQGRGLSQQYIDSIGQGRVWSGVHAKGIGLVDVFGGLEKAIEIAAGMANLTDYRLLELPKQKDPIEQIIEEFTGDAQSVLLKYKLGENYRYYKYLISLSKMEGIQARVPFEAELLK